MQVSWLVNLTHKQNGTWVGQRERTQCFRGALSSCDCFYHHVLPVGLCLMRKRKGLSTITQGGEDRAIKMAAEEAIL